MADFVEHYHRERNHQGVDNELIERLADGVVPATFANSSVSARAQYCARAA